MPKIISRHLNKIPKANEGGSVVPLHQTEATLGYKSFYTIPQTPQPAQTALSSGQFIYFDLESYECDTIEDICLRWTIRNKGASDVTLVPSAYFINRIIIEAEKGSGQELAYIYPEQVVFYYWTVLTNEQREKWARLSNFAIGHIKNRGMEIYTDDDTTIIRAGETKTIYFPIPVAWLHLHAVDMKHLVSDLRFRIEVNNDFVISGTKTDVVLDNLHMFIESPQEADFDKASRANTSSKKNHKYIYLDAERLTYNDKTLNASTETRWNLDQFVGKAPFLVVFIKPNTSPTASNRSLYNYQEVGEDATFDLENSSGRSIWGNGSPIKEEEVYINFSKNVDSRTLKGCYVVDFSDSIKKSLAGVINGIHQFTGQNDYLRVVFGGAPVKHTQKITFGLLDDVNTTNFVATVSNTKNTSSAPYPVSAQVTQGTAYGTPLAVKAAINALPAVKARGYSCDISVDTSGDNLIWNIIWDTQCGNVSKEIGDIAIVLHENVATATTLATAFDGVPTASTITAYGKRGWVSGANYQVEIFMYKYKEINFLSNGRIITKDL